MAENTTPQNSEEQSQVREDDLTIEELEEASGGGGEVGEIEASHPDGVQCHCL